MSWQVELLSYTGNYITITLPITFTNIYSIQNNVYTSWQGPYNITQSVGAWLGGVVSDYTMSSITLNHTEGGSNLILVIGKY